tara:strand:- start:4668 stop:5939 length:1272 start_codon:yes stop_codon:yes gene_type:complete
MSRLTGSDALGLYEAYQAVYNPQELTEEQVWEEVETWVNSLIEEGYDLSDYTWEEMFEAYISEAPIVPSMDQMVKKGFENQKLNQGFSKAATQLLAKPGSKPAAPAATPAAAKPAPTATRPAATAAPRPGAPARPAAAAPAASASRPAAATPTRPAASSPAPKPAAATAPAAKPSAMDQWDKANPRLAQAQQIRKQGGSRAEVNKSLYNKGTAAATSTPTVVKAGFDMFDIVKGYLIDEGYADTEEAALAIMINMSEEWRRSIVEERAPGVRPYTPNRLNPLPKEKPLSGKKGDGSGYGADEKFKKPDDKIEKPGTEVPAPKKGGYGRIFSNIPYGIGDHANRNRSRNSTVRGLDPGAPRSEKLAPEEKKKPSREIVRRNKDTNESYDIILSYLLDEGYANSVEAAESIMVSMSEDWVLSIIG